MNFKKVVIILFDFTKRLVNFDNIHVPDFNGIYNCEFYFLISLTRTMYNFIVTGKMHVDIVNQRIRLFVTTKATGILCSTDLDSF